MTSTPLFDQIARRAESQASAATQPAPPAPPTPAIPPAPPAPAAQPATPAQSHPAAPTHPSAAGTPPTSSAGATGTVAATAATPSATVLVPTASPHGTAPASPLGASSIRTVVPSALVAEINDIPALITAGVRREVALSAEQLALVEEIGDTLIRVVVDALAAELDRIASGRALRG